MTICRQACPYNTLDGCKVKEYGGICQLTNTVQPITEYRMTNADRIRSMSDEELAGRLVFMSTICEFCVKRKKCDDPSGYKHCMEGILDWLQQPAEEADND